METCHDHEIAYWPDMGCPMCAAQAEIARLQAEVEYWKEVSASFQYDLKQARNDALEEVAAMVETHVYTSGAEGHYLTPHPRAKFDLHHGTIAAAIRALKGAKP